MRTPIYENRTFGTSLDDSKYYSTVEVFRDDETDSEQPVYAISADRFTIPNLGYIELEALRDVINEALIAQKLETIDAWILQRKNSVPTSIEYNTDIPTLPELKIVADFDENKIPENDLFTLQLRETKINGLSSNDIRMIGDFMTRTHVKYTKDRRKTL